MSSKVELPRLHVITDEVFQDRYSHLELAEITVAAGADGVQYREKRAMELDVRISTASAMNEVCSQANSMLIVNDFVDVALAISAPAVHLGREDEAIASARSKLSDETIIGGTANSLHEATRVDQFDIDYLGVGPVFGTSSKKAPAPTLGLAMLAEICKSCRHPVIAIGNVQVRDIESVLQAGAHGVAVISAICCAADVAKSTREFCVELGL